MKAASEVLQVDPPATRAAVLRDFGERAGRHLVETILPFWSRTTDEVRGGVFNAWNNAGTQLVSRDKFTWSQGRFAWLAARLAEDARRGLLAIDEEAWLARSERTVQFLERHAFLPDGRCAFLLTETGEVREAIQGQGPAPSIYADCFVMMGLAEFARVRRDRARLDRAWEVFELIQTRIARGGFPTHPEPIPGGHESHAVAMIALNLALVLHAACRALGDARAARARESELRAAARIFDVFMQEDGRVQEMRPVVPDDTTLLSRHLNPGHALEGLWMLLTIAAREGRDDWRLRAQAAVRFALLRGWDHEHGGLLHYVDREGGPPTGRRSDSIYETGVERTWDAKLWWIHSEALFTTALLYSQSGDPVDRAWLERLWEYTFRVFPNPDSRVGEWIQIRDRTGASLDRVVALPVKDPYHITRNLLQLVELASDFPSGSLP